MIVETSVEREVDPSAAEILLRSNEQTTLSLREMLD